MNISAVDICNLALGKLGAGPRITSFESSELGQTLKLIYPVKRNEVLCAHEWNCAVERSDLTQLVDAPVSEYAYQYQLPVDPLCLQVLNMPEAPTAVYRIEGDRLLTNIDDISIRYVKEVTDTAKFPTDLIELIALKIAAEIAFKVTNSLSMKTTLIEEYGMKLMEAKGKNQAGQRQPEPETSTPWISEGR